MGANEGRASLVRAYKDLMTRWLETKCNWDDANTAQFEDEFLTSMEADIKAVSGAMEAMSRVIAQARRDCE